MSKQNREGSRIRVKQQPSPEKVTDFLLTAPWPVVIYGPDRRIIMVNPAFSKFCGFELGDLVGQFPPFPFWVREKYGHYRKGYFKADSKLREWEIKKKNGEVLWVEITNQLFRNSLNAPCLISYIKDVTDAKKAIDQARETEEKYSKIFDAVPLPLAITSLPEIRFINVNQAFEKTGGYSKKEIIGKPAPNLDWKNPQERDQLGRKIRRKRAVTDFEMRMIAKDGKSHTALMSARLVKFKNSEFTISVSTDITKMKEAEGALRESEAFNASLLRDAPNPIIVSNLDSSIRFVNPAFSKLTGFPKKEMLGRKPPFPWWPQGKNEVYWQENHNSSIQEIDSLERLIIKKNGQMAWIRISTRHIKEDGNIKYYVAIWTDVTQRKKVEEDLNAELVRRRILIDQSSDGIVVLDQDGAVYEANLRFAQMLGYTPQELRKLHVWDWGIGRSPEELLEVLRRTDENGHHFESRHRRKDGSIYNVEVSTNGAQFAGQKLNFCVCRDISQRKRAEAALRDSEHFSATLLNDAPYPILVTNADGSYRYANPALEKLTGYSSEQFIGLRPPPPWWPAEFIEQYLAENQTSEEKELAYLERYFLKRSGEGFWVSMSVRRIEDQGQLKYVLANWVDITERKKMEESLNASYQKEKLQREELEEEARLRGHFINVLAHELRTPITPILSSTDMLKSIYASKRDSVQKKLVDNIFSSSNTLAHRLEELLDMARHARGAFRLNIQPVELKTFIEGVISRFEPTLVRLNQNLVVNLALELPEADLDASRLEQVFINLLSNASKFSPKNSPIFLTVKAAGEQLLVEVRDTGIGISPEAQVRLFQPYYRVEQDRHQVPGLGLGLAVSRQIVEAHGGKIQVFSEAGKGSTFSFCIPFGKVLK